MRLKSSLILGKIAEFKENNDYEGFKKFVESLGFEDLLLLKGFARELNKYCDSQLSKHI
jgi:hypothetical protein